MPDGETPALQGPRIFAAGHEQHIVAGPQQRCP